MIRSITSGDAAPGTSGGFGVGVYLRLVSQMLALSSPIAMMLIIDKVVTQGGRNTLIALLGGVALLTVFQYLFLLTHTLHSLHGGEMHALPRRRRVVAALLGSSAAARLSAEGWDVVHGEMEAGRFAVETRPQAVADACYVVLLAVLMAAFSPLLLSVSLAFAPCYVLVEAWSSRRAERYARACAGRRSRISTRFYESVAGAELIRNLHLEAHVMGEWSREDGALAVDRYRLTLCRRLSAVGVEFLQRLSLVVIMLLGVSSVIAGAMTLGQYIAFNLLSMQLAQPLLRLASFRRARADDRLLVQARSGLEARCRDVAWPAGTARPLPEGPLVVQGDDLVLREGQAAIPGFVLRDGFWLGVVGASGCGKTTLLRALAGLHRPAAGRILLNGVPLLSVDPGERGHAVCLVPQEPVVFSCSIADNIRLGDPGAPPQRIVLAAQVSGLGVLLERLPAHLDTLVGPAGLPLSGGERQRIALARAVLRQPRVLLLDEATAALDRVSEAEVLGNLRRHLPECAVVVVSHRASSLVRCQQVLELQPPSASTRAVPEHDTRMRVV